MFFDKNLSHSCVLDQWSLGRTNIGATPAFKAIENTKFLCKMPFPSFHIYAHLFGREPHWAGFHAPTAMDAWPLFI